MREMVKNILKAAGVKRPGRPEAKGTPPETLLASLEEPYRGALLSMYRGEPQMGTDGQRHEIDMWTKVVAEQGMWFYNFSLEAKPKSVLEIGMAYGYSTLYFLAAMARNKGGRHTSIDPFQRTQWHGIALASIKACIGEANPNFRFIEDRSDRAAIDLARTDSKFDFIFIDGNHRFDDALIDFSLFSPLCVEGGHIALDDMWMPSIRTVAAFIRANRADFAEVPSGQGNISVFKKVGEDTRAWDHFQKFAVAG